MPNELSDLSKKQFADTRDDGVLGITTDRTRKTVCGKFTESSEDEHGQDVRDVQGQNDH